MRKISKTLAAYESHCDVWYALGEAEHNNPDLKKTAAWCILVADAERRLDRAYEALTDRDLADLYCDGSEDE